MVKEPLVGAPWLSVLVWVRLDALVPHWMTELNAKVSPTSDWSNDWLMAMLTMFCPGPSCITPEFAVKVSPLPSTPVTWTLTKIATLFGFLTPTRKVCSPLDLLSESLCFQWDMVNVGAWSPTEGCTVTVTVTE
jgi:hypothetical protein